MAMKNFKENFKNRAVKAKLSFMTRMSIILMLVLGAGALFGAWELNLQTKELHDESYEVPVWPTLFTYESFNFEYLNANFDMIQESESYELYKRL